MGNHCVNQIVKVLIYIEDHLDESMTMKSLSDVACYSEFHFHRVFQSVVGETVHKYVRRLRLELAAGKLRYSDASVTDIALDSQFDTPSAFAKAFKQSMGRTPKGYRALYKEVNAMKEKIEMIDMINPEKIEVIKSLPVSFIRKTGDYTVSSQAAWDAMIEFIHKNSLNGEKLRYFSIVHDNPEITSPEKLRFDACIMDEKVGGGFDGMGVQSISGGKYAIFIHNGPTESIDGTFDRIFLKWFPDSKENFDGQRNNFCEHLNIEYANKDESKLVTKIYIPIV